MTDQVSVRDNRPAQVPAASPQKAEEGPFDRFLSPETRERIVFYSELLAPWLVLVSIFVSIWAVIDVWGIAGVAWGRWLIRFADLALSATFGVLIARHVIAGRRLEVRNPQEAFGGVGLIWLAVFCMWASSDLPGLRGFAFGPGTAPRLFSAVLGFLGAVIAVTGLLTTGPKLEKHAYSGPLGGAVLVAALIPITYFSSQIGKMVPGVAPDVIVAFVGAVVVLALAFLLMRVAPRGPLFITAATLIFAVTVRPLGLVFASFVSLVVSAYATDEIRWIETLIWAVVLTAFCSALFPYGLNLPLQLWPRF